MKASRHTTQAFTLLEIILAVGIIVLLTGSIVAISTSTLNLTSTLMEEQEKQIYINDFENHIRKSVTGLTSDSKLELSIDEQNQGIQSLKITEPNTYFPLKGTDNIAKLTLYDTKFNANGLLDLIQVNYIGEDEEFIDTDSPAHEIILMENLTQIFWQFYHPPSRDWISDWESSMGIPRQIKFTYQHSEGAQQSIFIWLLNN